MNSKSFILLGDICDSRDPQHLRTVPNGFLVCTDGLCQGCFAQLPAEYETLPLYDHRGCLIIPGLTDLHVHAPQYALRGTGMDQQLLMWLKVNVFPEETKYADLTYAGRAYRQFVRDLSRSATTRACIFATVHRKATALLMALLEHSGMVTMVGKVNMDRDCPGELCETAEGSMEETVRWLRETKGQFENVSPIITPRFVPSCSDELMAGLGELVRREGLPVQSHLSENQGEVELVSELRPDAEFYGQAYDRDGLFGQYGKTVMAHCVLSSDREIALMKQRDIWIAHCPQSNTNLASGIAPIRRYLDEGLHVGLGSDVAGGHSLSILRAMADAIQVSKLRWCLQDRKLYPLTVPEAFWLGTAGGGSFFGRVGRFLPGYEFDAVVISDSRLEAPSPLSLEDRLARVIYLSEDQDILCKYVRGRRVSAL